MLKSQVLKSLPDKVFIRHDVEMSPKQAKAYKDIEKDLLTILDDGTVLVANGSLPGALRMLQFASAYCEVDQGETPEDPTTWKVTLTDTPKSSKIDEMMSIIEDTVTEDERGRIKRKPVVVAAEHRQLIDLASARLTEAGIPFGRVTGAESPDEREANVRAFQAGKLDVMLFTYAAGGVGINLTRADTMIRLQRSLVHDREQSRRGSDPPDRFRGSRVDHDHRPGDRGDDRGDADSAALREGGAHGGDRAGPRETGGGGQVPG